MRDTRTQAPRGARRLASGPRGVEIAEHLAAQRPPARGVIGGGRVKALPQQLGELLAV